MIHGDYKDKHDRIELWGVSPAFEDFIIADLLIVDANVGTREVELFHNQTGDSLYIRLPKDVLDQDLPASYNQAVIALLHNKRKLMLRTN